MDITAAVLINVFRENLGNPLSQMAQNQKEIIRLLSSIEKTLKEKGLEGLSAGQDFTERKK